MAGAAAASGATEQPNVLSISVDDINDWVGCLSGYPGVQTPNIDALARRGVLFRDAHCSSPVCNPSRTALLTGKRPSTTGVYRNDQYWRPAHPDIQTLPMCFRDNGYHVAGAGKIFHHVAAFNPPDQWDEFNKTTLRKVGLTLNAIEENWDDVFIVSDVDIQFFGPTEQLLRESIKDRDIVFQQNQANGEINVGFFVCRGNARTRLLWTTIQDILRERTDRNDQDVLNHLMFRRLPRPFGTLPLNHWTQYQLCRFAERGLPAHRIAYLLPLFRNEFGLRWKYLPRQFFLKGLNSRGNWEPGEQMRIPRDVVMHHANFCLGVDAKIEQLRAVSALVASRRAGSATLG